MSKNLVGISLALNVVLKDLGSPAVFLVTDRTCIAKFIDIYLYQFILAVYKKYVTNMSIYYGPEKPSHFSY